MPYLWTLQHALFTKALGYIHSSPGTQEGLWAAGWTCLKFTAGYNLFLD